MSIAPTISKPKLKLLANMPRDVFDTFTGVSAAKVINMEIDYRSVGADITFANRGTAAITVVIDKLRQLTIQPNEIRGIDNTIFNLVEIPSGGTLDVDLTGWSFDLIANL